MSSILEKYREQWESREAHSDVFQFIHVNGLSSAEDVLPVLKLDQVLRWDAGVPMSVADYQSRLADELKCPEVRLQLAIGEFHARAAAGQPVSVAEFVTGFPDLTSELAEHLSDTAEHDETLLHSTIDMDELCDEFEDRWRADDRPELRDYLRAGQARGDTTFQLQLIRIELWWRRNSGESPSLDDYLAKYPSCQAQIREAFRQEGLLSIEAEKSQRALLDSFISSHTVGDAVGRYRLRRTLGEGGFGIVYLAYDEELRRPVAIKVPKREFLHDDFLASYVEEARTVAGIEHPHIVPVYDVGRTEDGSIYVVSRFVDGCDLRKRLQEDRFTPVETARIAATIAFALHHAHERKLVHRDIKPANILLDAESDTPFLTDFGLAINEEEFLRTGVLAGTPEYMSPEQTRGEGHRLDRRSDIFALGVVVYEMLTGRKPFRGGSVTETLNLVQTLDPEDPRNLCAEVSAELARICLRAIEKRPRDRYATALQMAEELQLWNQGVSQDVGQKSTIVPRGLRSFGDDDADFFLELLPGPRNRYGVPESVQFWKSRIEESDADKTFDVGLIYGPSGCGKSSLVKAGLIPLLSPYVTSIYVEATPEGTESSLSRKLVDGHPDLQVGNGLVDQFSMIRRTAGNKVVIFIDQFEQWLHAHDGETSALLIDALRQCDGSRLQAIVLVRDDFSMAASRFMRDVDTRIVEGKNFATVDLFDTGHARKTLLKFGQAFGRLPMDSEQLSSDQRDFLAEVVDGLADGGKVVSVRLALFAEMVKGKAWVPKTLDDVGGTKGVGVNFLEETFTRRSANPEHRVHETAARRVLNALLPHLGSDIRGHMVSYQQLFAASGYSDGQREFDTLLEILDSDLRLITPTAKEGQTPTGAAVESERYYQLTHDYLVPALREWLTRRQKESVAGRAQLTLAERHSDWQRNQDARQLPSLLETARILIFARSSLSAESQKQMMKQASRRHVTRLLGLMMFCAVLVVTAGYVRQSFNEREYRKRLSSTVDSLLTAEASVLAEQIASAEPLKKDLRPEIARAFDREESTLIARRNAGLSLLALFGETGTIESISEMIRDGLIDAASLKSVLECIPTDVREANLRNDLWHALESPNNDPLPIVAALAFVDPDDERWQNSAFPKRVVDALLKAGSFGAQQWLPHLFSVGEYLTPSLLERFTHADLVERELICSIAAELAAEDVEKLLSLLVQSEPAEFEILMEPLTQLDRVDVKAQLTARLESTPIFGADFERHRSARVLPDQIRQQFVTWHGHVAELFAYCQTAPLDDFYAAVASLREFGLQPVRVRPYDRDGQTLVAGVFQELDSDREMTADLRMLEVITMYHAKKVEGFMPVDVAGYTVNTSDGREDRYAVVWGPNKEDAETGVFCGLLLEQLNRMTAKDFTSLQSFRSADGTQKYCGSIVVKPGHPGRKVGINDFEFATIDGSEAWYTDFCISEKSPWLRTPEEHELLLDTARKVVAENGSSEARTLVIDQLYRLGRYAEAIEESERLLKEDEESVTAIFRLTTSKMRLGQSAEIEALIDRTSTLLPNIAATKPYLLSFHHVCNADIERAFEDYECYLESAEPVASDYYNGACLYSVAANELRTSPEKKSLAFARSQELLDAAVAAGYDKWDELSLDSDLVPLLRTNPNFENVDLEDVRWTKSYLFWNRGMSEAGNRVSHVLLAGSPDEIVQQAVSWLNQGFLPVTSTVAVGSTGTNDRCSLLLNTSVPSQSEMESRARARALLSIALARLEQTGPLFDLLGQEADRRTQSWLIHLLAETELPPSILTAKLAEISGSDHEVLIRAILLGLCRYSFDQQTHSQVAELATRIYGSAGHAGVHSAAECLLRRLDVKDLDAAETPTDPVDGKDWYVASNGSRMIVIRGPIDFVKGHRQPPEHKTAKYWRNRAERIRIERDFAMSATEVTKDQFEEFYEECRDLKLGSLSVTNYRGRSQDMPQQAVAWTIAAAYCRWLSEKEQIPEEEMCYPPLEVMRDKINAVEEIELPKNFLLRTGYRLPSRIEWEYACRAGSDSSRYYGYSDQLLDEYAWHLDNSDFHAHPVGRLFPNQFGFFDMLGNVQEWCQDEFDGDVETPEFYWMTFGRIKFGRLRAMGGYDFVSPGYKMSALRFSSALPLNTASDKGFRIVRTLQGPAKTDEAGQPRGWGPSGQYNGY